MKNSSYHYNNDYYNPRHYDHNNSIHRLIWKLHQLRIITQHKQQQQSQQQQESQEQQQQKEKEESFSSNVTTSNANATTPTTHYSNNDVNNNLRQRRNESSYMIMLQHSHPSYALRLIHHQHHKDHNNHTNTAAQQRQHPHVGSHLNHNDEHKIYQYAGLRTPVENAKRDIQIGSLLHEYLINRLCSMKHTKIIYIKTMPNYESMIMESWIKSHRNESPDQKEKIMIVDCCGGGSSNNPYGWDDEYEQETIMKDSAMEQSYTCSIENLSELYEYIRSIVMEAWKSTMNDSDPNTSISIVLQSLTPIYMRHGFNQMIKLIQRMRQIEYVTSFMISIPSHYYTSKQNCILEDIANAVLVCHHGSISFLYQGIRERQHVIREQIEYDIMTTTPTTKHSYLRISPQQTGNKSKAHDVNEIETIGNSDFDASNGDYNDNHRHDIIIRDGKNKKLTLSYETEDDDDMNEQERTTKKSTSATIITPSAATATPFIYVQDDDPEYDDYDEEDPDDDLDL